MTGRTLNRAVALTVALNVGLCGTAQVQRQQSRDAVNWLSEKLRTFGGFTVKFKIDTPSVVGTSWQSHHWSLSSSGCRIRVEHQDGSHDALQAYLGDLDPTGIKVEQIDVLRAADLPKGTTIVSGPRYVYQVTALTKNQEHKVVVLASDNTTGRSNGVYFTFTDSDTAQRAAKALAVAINGCQKR